MEYQGIGYDLKDLEKPKVSKGMGMVIAEIGIRIDEI